MSDFQGKFVWYELMTTDTAAAEAFYKAVVGWGAQDSGVPGMSYTLFTMGEDRIGGLMAVPEETRKAGARPGWIGYVAVADVDAMAERIAKAGGTVHHAPQDIPNVGRFAVVADPQGAHFALFKGLGEGPAQLPDQSATGRVGWHELMAGEGESAFGFYSSMFGWTKSDAIDMGPMGIYQLFAIGGTTAGGMMTKPEQVPVPFWQFYVNVEAIDAAAARVTASGGKILMGPHEVPGGSWIIQGTDPQGAVFALVAPHR
ncbi:MAG TPA: VOC family protein [Aliidongia sp.]|nr:VOC family protein [Aliidongia sp.]